jgi:REP element-mobilizing transposase RayT
MSFGKPQRLEWIFPNYDPPVYFVTLCTAKRCKVLANERVHLALRNYANVGTARGYAVGRYVVMPDHIHLFVCGIDDFVLGTWVAGLKRVVAAAVTGGRSIWQRGFFDHVIRSNESYSEKWNYVQQNPVRAGLVADADEWPFQGEIVCIEDS